MTYSTKPALANGTTVTTTDGARYTVTQFLGQGGQGSVYRVQGPDGEYALKWYHADTFLKKIRVDAFHKNIRHNVMQGPPKLSSGDAAMQFIWPRKFVDWQRGSFGYLMQLFPDGYESLSDVIMGRRRSKDGTVTPLRWKSWFVRLTAALNLVRAFEILHAAGLSYQDLNAGGFAFNLDNGDVLICDCDNVLPDKTNLGILGVLKYMAPEVVRGEELPARATDQYSLAVILFQFFLHNHPMEGTESIALHNDITLSPKEANLRIYGTAPHYCLDTEQRLNPADEVRHADVRRLCYVYPTVLMQAFGQVFTRGVSDPSARLTTSEWRRVLLQARDCLVQVNGQEVFYHTPAPKPLPDACRTLICPGGHLVLCMPNKLLYGCHLDQYNADFTKPVCRVIATSEPGILGLYNGTGKTITAEYHGQARPCPHGGRTLLLPGMTLRIGSNTIHVDPEGGTAMPGRMDELWKNFNPNFFPDQDAGDMLTETPPADELEPTVANHRQILNILLIIDVSGSMEGQRIGMVNNALENIVRELRRRDDLNNVIRLGLMAFAEGAAWITQAPVPVHEYVLKPIEVQKQGMTNYGPAFRALNAKLTGNDFMDRSQGEYFAPLILFVSDGEPIDVNDYPAALEDLHANALFMQSARYAIAVGEEARSADAIRLLSQFTGNETNVRYADEGEALCSLIQYVALQGSTVQSSLVPEEASSLSSIFTDRDESLFRDR